MGACARTTNPPDSQKNNKHEAAAAAPAAAAGRLLLSDVRGGLALAHTPHDSAAALILLEHHWAVPLRDAIDRAGGFRISDGFISPFDLVAIGLVSAAEAEQLHALEQRRAAAV